MLTSRKKQNVIKETQVHDKDTGSAQVQVGLLTKQINELTKHLQKNSKDNSSRRGLLKMVARRRKFLDYLFKNEESAYNKIVKKLGLKR